MKFLPVLVATALVTGIASTTLACQSCGCSPKKEKACKCGSCESCTGHELSTKAMEKVVASKAATVVDARGSGAKSAHIPGAKILSTSSSKKEIAEALPNKNAPVVTYCSSTSCSASVKLAKKLKGLGYTNVREYPEGIKGWKEGGNKVASE